MYISLLPFAVPYPKIVLSPPGKSSHRKPLNSAILRHLKGNCQRTSIKFFRFSLKRNLYLAQWGIDSILTNFWKHLHIMMLPPPCFTVGMVLSGGWELHFILQAKIELSLFLEAMFFIMWVHKKNLVLLTTDIQITPVELCSSFRVTFGFCAIFVISIIF